jgi:non-homologous end joining protein Ku
MAGRGARNTAIAFGDFQLEVSFAKTVHSREPKTEYVRDEVDPETGEAVPVTSTMGGGGGGSRTPADGVYKAVRVSDSRVIKLDPERLAAITEASVEAHPAMEVLETIDYRSVPTERIVGSYWVQPRNGTGPALKLLTQALHKTDRVAVVKWISTSREKLGVLRPRRGGNALMLCELAFFNDFAEPGADVRLDDVAVTEQAVGTAIELVNAFARKRGDAPAVDTASDTAVDARLAYVEELHLAQFGAAAAAAGLAPREAEPVEA